MKPDREKSPEYWQIIRTPKTVALAGVCDMQLRRMEKAGTFPKRFKINPNGGKFGATGHYYGEVMEWCEARRDARAQQAGQNAHIGDGACATRLRTSTSDMGAPSE